MQLNVRFGLGLISSPALWDSTSMIAGDYSATLTNAGDVKARYLFFTGRIEKQNAVIAKLTEQQTVYAAADFGASLYQALMAQPDRSVGEIGYDLAHHKLIADAIAGAVTLAQADLTTLNTQFTTFKSANALMLSQLKLS